MKLFIVKERQFREQYRLLMTSSSLTACSDIHTSHGCHSTKTRIVKTERNCNERIVAATGTNRVETIFPRLESLLHITLNLLHSILIGGGQYILVVAKIVVSRNFCVLLKVFLVRFFGIRSQNLVYFRDGESAILTSGRADCNIRDNIERHVKRLWLVVPDIAHLKTAS